MRVCTGSDKLYGALLTAWEDGAADNDPDARKWLSKVLTPAARRSDRRADMDFVDLGRCGGFLRQEQWSEEKRNDEIEAWFLGDAPVGRAADMRILETSAKLAGLVFRAGQVQPLREWLAVPSNWATSGSSHWRGGREMRNGRGEPLKTKWNIPSTSSVEAILERVEQARGKPVELSVVIKREPEKLRLVVADSDTRYIVSKYLLHHFERNLIRTNDYANSLSLFWSNKTRTEYYARRQKLLGSRRTYCPIDIKEFDHNWSNALLEGVQTHLCLALGPASDAPVTAEGSGLPEAIGWYLNTMTNEIRTNGVVKRTTRGLASGLGLTALLGSWVNLCVFVTAAQSAGVTPLQNAHQGDDADACFDTREDARELLRQYYRLGVPMNPKKNFVSDTHSEYLRYVTWGGTAEGTFGYLGRAILSVGVRNPLNVDPLETEVDDIIGRYATLWGRGARKGSLDDEPSGGASTISWMLEELHARTGLRKEDLRDALHTPRSVGGLGLLELPLVGHTALVKTERLESSPAAPAAGSVAWSQSMRAWRLSSNPSGVTNLIRDMWGGLWPPKGGRARLRAERVNWAAKGEAWDLFNLLSRDGRLLRDSGEGAGFPQWGEALDPMFRDVMVRADKAATQESRSFPTNQLVALFAEPLTVDSVLHRLRLRGSAGTREVAYWWLEGSVGAFSPAGAGNSDSVVAELNAAATRALIRDVISSTHPVVSLVSRARLRAEFSVRRALELAASNPLTRQFK
jgi:hypothetical protein